MSALLVICHSILLKNACVIYLPCYPICLALNYSVTFKRDINALLVVSCLMLLHRISRWKCFCSTWQSSGLCVILHSCGTCKWYYWTRKEFGSAVHDFLVTWISMDRYLLHPFSFLWFFCNFRTFYQFHFHEQSKCLHFHQLKNFAQGFRKHWTTLLEPLHMLA